MDTYPVIAFVLIVLLLLCVGSLELLVDYCSAFSSGQICSGSLN